MKLALLAIGSIVTLCLSATLLAASSHRTRGSLVDYLASYLNEYQRLNVGDIVVDYEVKQENLLIKYQ